MIELHSSRSGAATYIEPLVRGSVSPRAAGVDLAARQTRPTGLALLSRRLLITSTVRTDGEILEFLQAEKPDIIAIDAPLSAPEEGSLRTADREMIRRGLRVLPPGLGPMRSLTERGIALARDLRSKRFNVIEVHPKSTAKVLGVQCSREGLLKALSSLGMEVEVRGLRNRHEVDAGFAALTGMLHLAGQTEIVGGANGIVIPSRSLSKPSR